MNSIVFHAWNLNFFAFLQFFFFFFFLVLPIVGMVVQEPFFVARVQRVSSSPECFCDPSPCKVVLM